MREAERLVIGKVDEVFELGMALDFADAVRREAIANRFDVLVDMRDCQHAISLNGLHSLPELMLKSADPWELQALIPHLVPAQVLEKFASYEQVTNRAGYRMKFFVDEAEAMQWLADQRVLRDGPT
ncbi:hypothetical protein HPT27_17315 [Permianibacter sp. IMCC34836]|uniref:hypothetical protein n=1 Tax=Permianibacter fluminis TaxID=2738515 RepID=UPI0015520E80|nr:hypothetical protein [Permianibacter fluminis]NQD38780.1 hypothetical protein [Permianibacter fluminis]